MLSVAATAARRFVAFLDREALGVVVVAFFALFSLVVIPHMLVQDTWLTLVSGREIFEHGLPRVDSLTVWSRGSTWIDRQWLAQLLFFWTASFSEASSWWRSPMSQSSSLGSRLRLPRRGRSARRRLPWRS